jgi:hypothetical protein
MSSYWVAKDTDGETLLRTLSETGEKGKDESGQSVNSAARTEPSYSAEARSVEGMRASQKAVQERDIRLAALPINGAPAAGILSGDNLHEKWSVGLLCII